MVGTLGCAGYIQGGRRQAVVAPRSIHWIEKGTVAKFFFIAEPAVIVDENRDADLPESSPNGWLRGALHEQVSRNLWQPNSDIVKIFGGDSGVGFHIPVPYETPPV